MSTSTSMSAERRFSIIDNIYAIIDSKLQYLEFQTKRLIQVLTAEFKNSTSDSIEYEKVQSMMIEDDLVLVHIEKTSKVKKMLIILRKMLCSNNASLVFKLLSNDQYLKYNEKTLHDLLEQV